MRRWMEAPLRSRITRVWLFASLWILALPATALATTQVRFLHAVPGVGVATVSADGQALGSAGFGQVAGPATLPSGTTHFVLKAPGGVTLKKTVRLADGDSYTLAALATANAATIHVYRNGAADPGKARLRVVHSAPELGDANVALDGKVVAHRAAYEDATDYWTLPPGREQLEVRDPGSKKMAIGMRSLPLSAGTTTTAYVVGSKGERVRVVPVDDATTAPSAAPQTGLGGLAPRDGGPNWALAAAAALAVGGAIALLRRRRPSR